MKQIGVKDVPEDIKNKLERIASQESVANNVIYLIAFYKFIELYEKLNGPVILKPKGEGLKDLI